MSVKQEKCHVIAPAVWVYADERQRAAERGSVFFFHGLGASKDAQQKELTSLAERGFLAIGIDNVGHGERLYPDFDQRFAGENPDFGKELLAAVALTAQELPRLVDAYLQAGIIQPDKLGVVGVSMGGYIAYAAVLAEPRLKVASVILGSPHWWEVSGESPDHFPERFYPTALLSQNAGQDSSVPAHYARDFHQTLAAYYTAAPQRQQYLEYPESGHFMRESDWNQCWERNLNWLETHI